MDECKLPILHGVFLISYSDKGENNQNIIERESDIGLKNKGPDDFK